MIGRSPDEGPLPAPPGRPDPKPDNPLIVQPDRTLLLHTTRTLENGEGVIQRDSNGRPLTEVHPRFEEARTRLASFAELIKSPDYLHTYKLTPVSVWNAVALGWDYVSIETVLFDLACVPIPGTVLAKVQIWVQRFGLLELHREGARFELVCSDRQVLEELLEQARVRELCRVDGEGRLWLDDVTRGPIKQVLIRLGFPVRDLGGYVDGDPLPVAFRETTVGGLGFGLRDYQRQAAEAFHADGGVSGGNGVIVLPCGAGKTVTAMAAMEKVGAKTLILTTNTVAVRQWRSELLDKTHLAAEDVGEYTGMGKQVAPVTISTYQMLTHRKSKTSGFDNLEIFRRENWGLVIYDEVHLLPAPVFRITAELQARRRLGLTATLVREDGKEDEVFCLIGPKRFELPWKQLEADGFIATAQCVELRVPLDPSLDTAYAQSTARNKMRIAAESIGKIPVIQDLSARHGGQRILVIGQYLEQLETLQRHLSVPLITGKTPNLKREQLYADFRSGAQPVLVVSKVGNFAIDLPDATVAIQISGSFGSRQEEAQRLGRILRPKADGASATFYSVVSENTREQEFAEKRQLFLAEQGYAYRIVRSGDMDFEGKDPEDSKS
ncbi:MAG: helicase-associated domain-containing protein [Planctomycetota bacterium]|nr:helicase-associated domain-containing protein [Planctomycetota bacterium]